MSLPFRSTVCAQTKPTTTWKPSVNNWSLTDLSASRSLTLNRLHNLERRLVKDSEIYAAYHNFIDDYVALGHMRPVSVSGKYLISHHAVLKRRKRGLKILVVFDASAKSTSKRFLNDCFCTDPKLQTELKSEMYYFVADSICNFCCGYYEDVPENSSAG